MTFILSAARFMFVYWACLLLAFADSSFSLSSATSSFVETVKGWRHHLHQIPELGFHEKQTTSFILSQLKQYKRLKIHSIDQDTGVVAQLFYHPGGKTIGLRADIDALPIQENNDISYKSKNLGVSHKCGHDGHTAQLLGAIHLLNQSYDTDFARGRKGSVVFVFQPAEEVGTENSGAARLMRSTSFTQLGIDEIYGMHNWPGLQENVFVVHDGPVMANVDSVHITVIGKGGHGAMPHQNVDPVVAGSAITSALQTIVSREIDPIDSAVVTVGAFNGGTATNVIPNQINLLVTLRSFNDQVRFHLREAVQRISTNMAKAFRCQAVTKWDFGYPATINHKAQADIAREVAASIGEITVVAPSMGGEDFSLYLNEIPGAFVWLGAGEDWPRLHNEKFDYNDKIISKALQFFTTLVANRLDIEQQNQDQQCTEHC